MCFLLRFGSSAKVVHFLGSMKPWKYKYNPQTGSVLEEGCGLVHKHQLTFLNLWWEIYHHGILPVLKSIRDEQEHASPRHPVRGQFPSKPRVENRGKTLHVNTECIFFRCDPSQVHILCFMENDPVKKAVLFLLGRGAFS